MRPLSTMKKTNKITMSVDWPRMVNRADVIRLNAIIEATYAAFQSIEETAIVPWEPG